MAGILYIVATPIGNLDDMPPRVAATFGAADFVAAEDTRVTMRLLNYLGLKKPMVSYYEHALQKGEGILRRIEAGENCALCSDAGMPCVSDPGERGIKARRADIADRTRIFLLSVYRVLGTERIAVVLYQPQTISFAEGFHGGKVERVSQRMRYHYRLGLRGQRSFQHRNIDIVLRNGDIHEYGNRSVLNGGSNGGRKTRRNRNDFVPAADSAFAQKRRG